MNQESVSPKSPVVKSRTLEGHAKPEVESQSVSSSDSVRQAGAERHEDCKRVGVESARITRVSEAYPG